MEALPPELDRAWADAEAALPTGWWIDYLMLDNDDPVRWAALARKDRHEGWVEGLAATPAGALRALLGKLEGLDGS